MSPLKVEDLFLPTLCSAWGLGMKEVPGRGQRDTERGQHDWAGGEQRVHGDTYGGANTGAQRKGEQHHRWGRRLEMNSIYDEKPVKMNQGTVKRKGKLYICVAGIPLVYFRSCIGCADKAKSIVWVNRSNLWLNKILPCEHYVVHKTSTRLLSIHLVRVAWSLSQVAWGTNLDYTFDRTPVHQSTHTGSGTHTQSYAIGNVCPVVSFVCVGTPTQNRENMETPRTQGRDRIQTPCTGESSACQWGTTPPVTKWTFVNFTLHMNI